MRIRTTFCFMIPTALEMTFDKHLMMILQQEEEAPSSLNLCGEYAPTLYTCAQLKRRRCGRQETSFAHALYSTLPSARLEISPRRRQWREMTARAATTAAPSGRMLMLTAAARRRTLTPGAGLLMLFGARLRAKRRSVLILSLHDR